MKEKIRGNGEYELILSQGECGYQTILDDFENANEIHIVTYNISRQDRSLLESLKQLDDSVDVKIITNIPSRFENYFSEGNRNNARGNIQYYLSNLRPDQYQLNFLAFFNFSNHSKIIMTENIAYIGSANYSSESARNIECGFITRDSCIINQIKEIFIGAIQEDSVRYYGNLLSELEITFMSFYTRIEVLFKDIFYNVLSEDVNGMGRYNSFDPYIRVDSFEGLINLIEEYERFIDANEEKLYEIMQDEEIVSLQNIREILEREDSLYELVYFDDDEYTNEYLNDEYGLEAYDEYLDKYVEMSSDAARDKRQDIAECAESEVWELYNNSTNICAALWEMIEYIQRLQAREEIIDNT